MMRSIFQTSLRRQLSPFHRTIHVKSSRLALAKVGPEIYDSDHSNYKSLNSAWFVFSASLAVAAATSKATARCDDEDEEDDPYDNLPEEDEPTHCSICMTYRQGPCRPYWRKVEACTKDNELKEDDQKEEDQKEEDDRKEDDRKEENIEQDGDSTEEEVEERDPPCLKYMLPWIECATGYRNLYNLIELDTNYTMGIADLEKEATQNLCWAPSNTPDIDWSPWQAYVKENEWEPAKSKPTNPDKTSLWKTLPLDKDPELVEVQATVAMTQDGGVLECAYAQDQDGNVIGFSYGNKPSEASEVKDKEEGEVSTVTLKVRILPTNTQTVTIASAYTHSGIKKEGNQEGEELESHIFKSRPYSVKEVAKSS